MKRRNPYPGIHRVFDRHGRPRWRARSKGRPSAYIHGEYGSPQFEAEYDAWLKGEATSPSREYEYGSIDWLIQEYFKSPGWKKLAPVTRRNLVGEFERFRTDHGSKLIKTLRPHHVEVLIAKKAETPAAANKLLKLVRRLVRFAIRREIISVDPTVGVEPYAMNPDGYHTWTDEEIAKFEHHHGVESRPVLAMRLMLYTGAARQDVIRLGWQSVKGNRISYRRGKTGGDVNIPMMPDLVDVLAAVPTERMLFITHSGDRPYRAETFGNWFRDQCVDAGLGHCSAHGLRKAGATRLANAGANEFEIMAFLGHKTPSEARTYVKKANRVKLADSGFQKLQGLSNQVVRLDKGLRNRLKRQGK